MYPLPSFSPVASFKTQYNVTTRIWTLVTTIKKLKVSITTRGLPVVLSQPCMLPSHPHSDSQHPSPFTSGSHEPIFYFYNFVSSRILYKWERTECHL